MALSLFPSSERSQHKAQADKAHRPPLDDFMAVSKAERAPERSLVQPPAHDKKRLRDCSSERSEGRLPGQGARGELGLCCSSACLPLGAEGSHCFWASSPHRAPRLLLPAAPDELFAVTNRFSFLQGSPQHWPFLAQMVLFSFLPPQPYFIWC